LLHCTRIRDLADVIRLLDTPVDSEVLIHHGEISQMNQLGAPGGKAPSSSKSADLFPLSLV
jgi:hypothetical protein